MSLKKPSPKLLKKYGTREKRLNGLARNLREISEVLVKIAECIEIDEQTRKFLKE